MTRVIARPSALLDYSPQAARIIESGTDAERYHSAGRTYVFNKIPSFIGHLTLLSNPKMPCLGFALVDTVANHVVTVIQGENYDSSGPDIVYGFGVSQDGDTRFLELSRRVDDETEVLAYLDVGDLKNPVFREANLLDIIGDEARIEELIQLLAIGEDATEWALD